MPSLEILKKRGITSESLKDKFSDLPYLPGQPTNQAGNSKLLACANRVRLRVQDGINNNWNHYKVFHAIDEAFEIPFHQISPTLARSLARGEYDERVLSAAREWGMTSLITESKDPKTNQTVRKVSLPAFFNIFVPLVRAYTIIRAAKLTQDRNLTPYFKFDPTKNVAINRARCEIITDRVEAMVTQMGLRDVGRQAILKTLLYGEQLMFIQEEWWRDTQIFEDGEDKEKEFILREGLRYHLPHPSRTYRDQAHPASTLNTNNGCRFAGYWRVHRYRDVKEMGLWNTDKIKFHGYDPKSDHAVFFNSVYSACTMSFPQSCAAWSKLDREHNLADNFYTSDFDDSGVILTEHFEIVNPEKDGIGDYKYPVWFRFVVAGDGTIMYAAPLPEHPVIYLGYDPDDSKVINPSLALEILPFQDQISNLLTQALLSVRQNLSNLTFVDQDIVDEKALKEIENLGEAQFRKLNFLRFSGRKTRAAQQDVRYAFGSVRFPQLDVPSILNAINAVLAVLERVLVMSAQEIAGQATHEQSREEILHVRASTSTRLAYTSMQIDRAWDGWKRQLYGYLMAFGDPEIYAELSQDPAYTPELLTLLGFTFEVKARTYHDKHYVKGNKKALRLEYFSSTRDGSDRVNDTALAQAMMTMLANALNNQMIAQVIGPEQAIMLINQVLEQMGLPRDFKLRPAPQMQPDQLQQWVQSQLLEVVKQVKQFVSQGDTELTKQFRGELKSLADAVKDAIKQGDSNEKKVEEVLKLLAGQSQTQTRTAAAAAVPKLTIGGPAQ